MSAYFLVILLFILRNDNFLTLVLSAEENCTTFLNTYQEEILGSSVPTTLISGATLKYCTTNEKTCCTSDIEDKLLATSKNDFEKTLKKPLQTLSKMFKQKSVKFNDYFKDLLTKSKKDFHEMFKKTYGIVYEQNSYVFSDFFTELERYFLYGKSNLADVMDNFFNILYQKMFTVINNQYKLDTKYLGCVSEHMNDLQPFGDVPQKLSSPLKRSFVAARTYAQSLNYVGNIVENLINMMPDENCFAAVLKMLHCSSCKGLIHAKVCHNYCVNIMKGCLAFHTEIDAEWNNFVDAMSKVEQRLLGPFNIELVVDPINVKISDAIMNFQENASKVSARVFNGCGKPPLLNRRRRRRRQANNFSESSSSSEFERRLEQNSDLRTGKKRKEKEEANGSPPRSNRNEKNRRKGKDDDLDQYRSSPAYGFLKFIKEIGTHVSSTKFFWKRLPYHVCNDDMQVENNRSAVCWNGSVMGNYDIAIVSDGMKSQQTNPEVPVDSKRHFGSLSEQVYALKSVSMQLLNAFNGLDVEWIDSEETFDTGSGSGLMPDSDGSEDDNVEGSGEGPPFIIDVKPDSSTVISDIDSRTSTNINNINYNTSELITPATTTGSGDVWKSANTTTTTPSLYNVSSTISTVDSSDTNIVHNDTSSGTTIRYEKISLNKAIASYLLPTVVIWVGGSFNDWFNSLV